MEDDLNLFSCLHFLLAGITGLCQHPQFLGHGSSIQDLENVQCVLHQHIKNCNLICALGAQMNISLMPQDTVTSNARKSAMRKPVVASSLKRQGKFPFLEGASWVEAIRR